MIFEGINIGMCRSRKLRKTHGCAYVQGLVAVIMVFLFLSPSKSFSQDLHLSQFFAAPLMVNPSNTGFFNGTWRIGGNYKSQWSWAIQQETFNYNSVAAYTDFAFLKTNSGNRTWMGAGLIFLNDKTGDGSLRTNKILLSLGAHHSFGRMKKVFVSVGINGGYVQKSIDYKRLYFNDQWDPDNLFFDKSGQTTGPGVESKISYIDFSAGTHVTYIPNKDFNFSLGASFFHLNAPAESFFLDDNALGIRPVVNALAYARITQRVHLEPGFLFMYQKKAQEYIISALAGFTFISEGKLKNSILFAGAAFRAKDAWIPLAGYQYKTLRVMLNYDFNFSSLTAASEGHGGFELSAVYIVKSSRQKERLLSCPRF